MDKFSMGAAFAMALTLIGRACVHKHMPRLVDLIEQGKIDPTFPITHRMNLCDAAEGYRMFDSKEDNCVKVVLRP